ATRRSVVLGARFAHPNPRLLSAQRDLQIRGAVRFRVEASAVDVSSSPIEHIVVEVNQVVLHEVATWGQAERDERLAKDALGCVDFPFGISVGRNSVEDVRKGLGQRSDVVSLVRDKVYFLCSAGDGVIASPAYV